MKLLFIQDGEEHYQVQATGVESRYGDILVAILEEAAKDGAHTAETCTKYLCTEYGWIQDSLGYIEVLDQDAETQSLIFTAREIARKAHEGQVDKGGHDYILHPLSVARAFQGWKQKIVATLHDVVEDCPDVTLDLLDIYFEQDIIDAIDAITRRQGETQKSYIERVKGNELANEVKQQDILQNMDLSRIKTPTEKDHKRVESYKAKLEYLRS